MREKNKDMKILIEFFALTYILSWTCWWLSDIFNIFFLQILGRFGPFISAIIITIINKGKVGTKQLLKKVFIWKVEIKWYFFSFISTAIIVITAIKVNQIITGIKPSYNDPKEWYLIFLVFFYVLFFSVLGEEIGWRGIALPALQRKLSALTSGIIIGIIWGAWHFPLFLIEGEFHQTIPIGLFIIQGTALSILMTWLYNNTKGSLLISHLFHTASNITIGLLPVLPMDTNGDMGVLNITIIILIVFTIIIIVANGPKHLSRKFEKVTE